MRLYTSHWRSRLLEDVDAQMISISRGEPKWRLPFRYRRLPELAPDDHTWRQKDEQAGRDSYERQLREIGADRILERFAEIGAGRAVIALCWERDPTDPETPCHRRYLAEFLEREAGVEVRELRAGDLPQRQDMP